jgi:DNA-binding NarL/FixJ family response regulator
MVGPRSVAALSVTALLMLGASAPALADEAPRMVMVTGSPAAIEALEGKGYDVGFVGELNEAGVYVNDASEARLRAEGYTIGQTVEDENSRLAVRAQTAAMAAGEALAANVAKNGLTQSNKAKGAVNVPGNVVIQRAYTFTNYAGRFLYLEAHNKLHGDSTAAVRVGASDIPLSESQRKVLVALCRPLKDSAYAAPATNKDIAQEVFLSVDAVKAHLRVLFERFDLDDLPQNQKRARLAAVALVNGVVKQHEF